MQDLFPFLGYSESILQNSSKDASLLEESETQIINWRTFGQRFLKDAISSIACWDMYPLKKENKSFFLKQKDNNLR